MNTKRPSESYYRIVSDLFARLFESQSDALAAAATAVAECIKRDGIIYLLGSGHSLLPAYEVHNRAGGLAPVNVILDPGFGRAERVAGYAEALWGKYEPERESVLFVISNSGRNALPIEMALLGKDNGMTVIAITSLSHTMSTTSRHPSGKRLFEIADIVIDNCGVAGDASVDIAGIPNRMGATSTLTGVAIVNAIMMDAAAEAVESGIEVPVLVSANLDGSDAKNKLLYDRYRARVTWV